MRQFQVKQRKIVKQKPFFFPLLDLERERDGKMVLVWRCNKKKVFGFFYLLSLLEFLCWELLSLILISLSVQSA